MQKRQSIKSSNLYYKSSGDNDEEEDEFIGDPLLAALVNENKEIIVNDTIYKFTKEKGLYFAHVKDSTYFLNYFKQDLANANKSSSKTAKAIALDLCEERAIYEGVTRVDERIFRFVAPIEDEDDCYGGNNDGAYSPPLLPQVTEEQQLLKFVNGLTDCDVNKPLFQNIFGRTFVCIDYFDSKHRIKTEFWDQNYLFYQSVGIQTKVQTKTLWSWWESDADVIYLGINRILLKYNFPQPEINSYSHPQLFPTNSYKNPIYMWDGKFNVNVGTSSFFPHAQTYVETQLKIPSGNLPFFNIENSQILNIYIPKLFKKGKYNLNLEREDITSQSNIKELYQMGIDFLNSPNVANTGSSPKSFSVIYQKDFNNIEVIYFGDLYKKTNTNDLKRTLYNSGANFVIGYASTEGPKTITTTVTDVFGRTTTVNLGTDYTFAGKFSIKPVTDYFRDYTYYDLDFYAVGRRGNNWAGSRMIKSEKK